MITFGKCPCNRLAPLDNGWCADCRQRLHIGPGPLDRPAPPAIAAPFTVAELMGRLVAELEAEEVIDPLAQRFTLAGIWSDLARLAGEPLPPAAATVLGDTLDTPIVPLPIPVPGGYADYVREALPAD